MKPASSFAGIGILGGLLGLGLAGTLFASDDRRERSDAAVIEVGSYVAAVAFAPDGRLLATASHHNGVQLWDVGTGREVRRLPGHRGRVWTVAFSPDGRRLASAGSDGTVRFWDPATGRELHVLSGHKGPVRSAPFSPDGKTLASSGEDGAIHLWEVAAGKALRSLGTHSNPVRSVAFAPDGKRLAAGTDEHALSLWEVNSGKAHGVLARHEGVVRAIAFAPDGETIASASDDGTVRLTTVAGQLHRLLTGHEGRVVAVAFTPDGQTVASADTSYMVRLWELATGREVCRFTRHKDWVVGVAISADGRRLATGSADHTVRIWDLNRLYASEARPVLSPQELDRCWADLATDNASQGYRAIAMLTAAAHQAVPLLRQRLRTEDAGGTRPIAQLVGELDSDRFPVRKRAAEELAKLAEVAEPALRKVLQGRPSVEVHQCVTGLLERLQAGRPTPERLRALRALQVLERVGTAEAREVLQTLAGGAPESRLTREARAVLKRLDRRTGGG